MEESIYRLHKVRIKTIVSSKQSLFEDRMNEEIDKLEKEGYTICNILSNISFAGEKGYMILGTIEYIIEEGYKIDNIHTYDVGIDFGAGMSCDDGSSVKTEW